MESLELSSFHSKHNGCRLCESSLLRCLVPLPPVPIGEHYTELRMEKDSSRYPIDIYQCMTCGGVQTNDNIDPAFLWKDYTYFSGHTDKIVTHFKEFASSVSQCFSGKINVLDIGSNDGSLLKQFQALGYDVQGIDPASTVADEANRAGVPTYLGLFSEDTAKHLARNGGYELITAFNVFAHSQDMAGMARGVKELLAKEGVFCFEVQYLEDISKKLLLGTFFHEHMIHYSLYSAQKFLENHGLSIFHFTRNKIQNGSIIIYAAHVTSDRLKSSSTSLIQKQIQHEIDSGLCNGNWSFDFNDRLKSIQQSVNQFLSGRNIEKVSAFGAARSGPTLAITYGLDHRISEIFDDHPSKTHRYSPYLGLKVRPTVELSAKTSPICVILAYIHFKSIIRSQVDYLLDGGTLLLLWPTFTVITSENYHDYIDV